eukprot:10204832-Alexandrium_andersonii.AAC.1
MGVLKFGVRSSEGHRGTPLELSAALATTTQTHHRLAIDTLQEALTCWADAWWSALSPPKPEQDHLIAAISPSAMRPS